MPSEELVRGVLYLSLTVVGVPGNASVILAFLLLLYQENRLLPADAIVLHLACVNLLVMVRCLLETLASFSLAIIFGDLGCKSVIFVYRTSRSLSIWITFLLSAYQCLSITPPRLTLGLPILFSFGTKNESSPIIHGINIQFCFVNFPSKLSKEANGIAQVVRDVVPMALMTLASLILLVFLYKHSHQVKGLRSSSGGGGGAEQRAAKVVVALVSLYVVLYGVDNGLWVYTLTEKPPHEKDTSLTNM
ncbi:hypothetical protein CesoFtcFv8_001973 [Champsocephalus esox]|uniref:Vomeronasal type-1 receptor n=1 Tax=Champsocephalus esox TaxID=159716 RepID=A0AAN8CY54_9TELE|nr:hypothetical protein CesoFtcFv8_001973 [Champsocephalus esox]